uniref:Chemosensory protein n=1 Tax=Conogethes punctiferalis TaxID=1133088 RepID=A0A2H4FXY1_CONPF|nr:chemosensory protein [Conogethes punctiferalis]
MKFLLVLSAVLALTIAETYKTTHDNIDVESIVTNPETLKAFTQCFLDKGECNEIAIAFKRVLPEATATACAKCTPEQKHMLRRYLEELKKTSPEDFEAIKQEYDPEGQYVDALRAAIADA